MNQGSERTPASAPCGGAVYGLGLIGALIWFWQQATVARARHRSAQGDRLAGVPRLRRLQGSPSMTKQIATALLMGHAHRTD
jgi:hypothetical protein